MKGTDKQLIIIVAAILLLVVAALLVVLLRPEPQYRTDASPEAVVHNYLLALQNGDHELAYGALSPNLLGYPPDYQSFLDDVEGSYRFRMDSSQSLNVREATITRNSASVVVSETTFGDPDLFDSGPYTRTFTFKLRLENGQWKIAEGGDYWTGCWEQAPGDTNFCY